MRFLFIYILVAALFLTKTVLGQTYVNNPFVSGTTAVQRISFSPTPVSGTYSIDWERGRAYGLSYNSTSSTIQTKLRTISQLSAVTVSGDASVGAIDITFAGYNGNPSLLSVSGSTLVASGDVTSAASVSATTVGVATKRPTTSTWVELVPSMGFSSNYVTAYNSSTSTLLLGVGAAGSEVGLVQIFPQSSLRYNAILLSGQRVAVSSVSGDPTTGALNLNIEKNY